MGDRALGAAGAAGAGLPGRVELVELGVARARVVVIIVVVGGGCVARSGTIGGA
jgi:hypothetical protein